ncbi:MAG TPA: type II CAAX endopeptidase family protein [Microlunatus sp.]|nr:type II CAAX endopeptidase family protein [Microlunatus sp.]
MPIQLGDRRVLHPGRWRWLRALAWLVLLFFLTAAAFGLPLQAAVDRLPSGDGAAGLAARLIACTAALGCYALAVRLGEGRQPCELALRPALPGLASGALLGLVMMTALMGLLAVTGLYNITLSGGAAPPWAGLGLALQAAVTEELWMRALLFRQLWRAFGPVPAFTVAALVFGALHLANPGASPLAGATVVAAGLMFCVLYTVTGRLWVPIGVHLAWNLTQGYLFGATVSGAGLGSWIALSTARPGAPVWLTGGGFGPEASVLALITISAVTVGVLALARRRRTTPTPAVTSASARRQPSTASGLHRSGDVDPGTASTPLATVTSDTPPKDTP